MPRPTKYSKYDGRPNSLFQMIENTDDIRIIPFGKEYEELYSPDERAMLIVDLVSIGDKIDGKKMTDGRDVEDENKKRILYANAQLNKIRKADGKRCEIRNSYVEICSLDDNVVIPKNEINKTMKPVSMMGKAEMEKEVEMLICRQREIYERLYQLNQSIHIDITLLASSQHEIQPKSAVNRIRNLTGTHPLSLVLEECNLDTPEENLEPITKYIEKIREAVKMPSRPSGKNHIFYLTDDEIIGEILNSYEVIIDNRETDDDGNPIGEIPPFNPRVIALLKTWYVPYE